LTIAFIEFGSGVSQRKLALVFDLTRMKSRKCSGPAVQLCFSKTWGLLSVAGIPAHIWQGYIEINFPVSPGPSAAFMYGA
jgi:hypothetical protein